MTATLQQLHAESAAGGEVTWGHVRDALDALARQRGEWAGCPLVVAGAKLVLEPRYPFAGLNGATLDDPEPEPPPADYAVVNSWRCRARRAVVYVLRERDGRTTHALVPDGWPDERAAWLIRTLGAARALDTAAELRATSKLSALVPPHAFEDYLKVGMFLETSKRSRVSYVFRKNRPTLALWPNRHGTMSVLCGLCLHPIGYYSETYCGVMVPTDDVVAHLLLMRGDEHRFWKKASQHDPESPQVGL